MPDSSLRTRFDAPARAGVVAALAVLLAGCAAAPPATTRPGAARAAAAPAVTTTEGGVTIDTTYTARGQDSRVMFLVIHYTVSDFPLSLRVLTEREVSAHYLVSDEPQPRIFRLVDESRRAWHSGASAWKANRRLNASSVGIEIVHPGFMTTPDGRRVYLPFPQAQIDVLIPLVQDIVRRHGILPERILGHGEVTPAYKEDPGPTFPWKRLAELGITPPWPDAARVGARRALYAAALPDVAWFQLVLAQHGYEVPTSGVLDAPTRRVLMNFQMRYRPALYDGEPDAETGALLWVLTNPGPVPAAGPGLPSLPDPASGPEPGPDADARREPAP